jgi:N-formylglutamate amidohydrolase
MTEWENLRGFLMKRDNPKFDMGLLEADRCEEILRYYGSIRVVFPASRLLVDPERFADDSLEPMNEKGMGVLYTKTYRGIILRPELNEEERRDLLANYFYPHQRKVSKAVQAEIEESGASLLIDCHSFPSQSYI